MNSSQLAAAVRAGRRVYGTCLISDSPRWPAAVVQLGLDFVFIDTEHIAIDRQPLSWMCQTYAALGLAPIVRIPSPDPHAATMALDTGAVGIVAPYVETVEQVKALRGAVKLRPIKGARLEAVLDGREKFELELAAYQQARYGDNLVIINVESRPALDHLDALLAVEGLDGVLIGPHDLSCSLGVPERYDAPEYQAAVATIARKARARGIAAGIHSWMGVQKEVELARAGYNFIIHSSDFTAMREKLSTEIRELRQVLGDEVKAGDGRTINV